MIMLKYSTYYIILIAVAIIWAQKLYAQVDENNSIRDAAVDFTVQSWKEKDDIPEPYRSNAIQQIKALKKQEWKGLANFFFQSLDIDEKAKEKAAMKPATIKRQTENNNNQSTGEIMKELFIELLLSGAKSSEEYILERKFKDAINMKFNAIDDFGKYCINVYEEVTGRKSPAES